MMPIDIARVGVVSALGIGFDAYAAALRAGMRARVQSVNSAGDSFPPCGAITLGDFDAAAYLGRKGLSTLDRITQFSIAACKQIADDRGISAPERQDRCGLVLGSAAGGLRSTSDFIRTTYTSALPYQVSPLQFPNAIMNSAASQCAIRFDMRGVNATICAGELSGLAALGYASRMLRAGHADNLVAGSAEEFCGFGAWSHHAAGATDDLALGEGSAVFELQASRTGRHAPARLKAIRLRRAGRDATDVDAATLGGHIRRMLEETATATGAVTWWSAHRGVARPDHALHREALRLAGLSPDQMHPVAHDLHEQIGFTGAASTSLQLAAAIATAPSGMGVLTAIGAHGDIACALVEIPAIAERSVGQ